MKKEFYDLKRKWNNYGSVINTDNISNQDLTKYFKIFSEGCSELEKLLNVLYDLKIKTKACCKGSHLSVNVDNLPKVSASSYIAFLDSYWVNYLSETTIKDKFIIIENKVIRYYGNNPRNFFNILIDDFESGIKNNEDLIIKKINKKPSENLKKKNFETSLINIGFNLEETKELTKLYFEFKKYNSKLRDAKQKEIQKIEELSNKYLKEYNDTLVAYIKKHNRELEEKL